MSTGCTEEETRFQLAINDLITYLFSIGKRLSREGQFKILTEDELEEIKQGLLKQDRAGFIDEFIDKSYPFWGEIKSKSKAFLNDELAGKLFGSVMPTIRKKIMDLILTDKNTNLERDETAIWNKLTGIVKVSIKYIYKIRSPKVLGEHNYRVSFKPDIDVKHWVKEFEIDLLKKIPAK